MDWLGVLGLSALSSFSVTAVAIFLFRKYIGSQIEHIFGKKLEEHKQKLNVMTEEARFYFQRKIQDFTLYATKRHEGYTKLHTLLQDATSKIRDLDCPFNEPNFTEARRTLEKTVTLYQKYYLYLSSSVIEIIDKLLKHLQDLFEEHKVFYDRAKTMMPVSNNAQDKHSLQVYSLDENVEVLGKELLEKMRSELSMGYYPEKKRANGEIN
jgi:hypothetical protein